MIRRLALVGLCGTVWCGLTAAATPRRRVPLPACKAMASTAAQRIRLKALLRQLAAQRRFRVEYWASDDPEVVPVAGTDIEVMTALANHANLVVRYAPPDRRCPGQWKVDTVWVLPTGQPLSAAVQAAVAPTPPDAATVMYFNAHGPAIPADQAASAAPR